MTLGSLQTVKMHIKTRKKIQYNNLKTRKNQSKKDIKHHHKHELIYQKTQYSHWLCSALAYSQSPSPLLKLCFWGLAKEKE